MTPGARVQAAIEILDAIAAGGSGRGGAPADAVVNLYVRARRYIGSKDRAAILGLVYSVLRRRAQLDWWIGYAREGAHRGTYGADSRRRAIAALAILERWPTSEIAEAFDGSKFRPAILDRAEGHLAAALAGRSIDHPDQPEAVRFNSPEWLLPELRQRFGGDLAREMQALNEPAPLDLRVNVLKGTRAAAVKALAAGGITAAPTKLSPWGLRVEGRPNLPVHDAFKTGLVEVQDEGSQLAALLVDAQPGFRICDFCAGAGGKSLAIAAAMQNKGHVVACDVSGPRLDSATKRLRRAGVHNVERRHLEGERDPWVKRHAGAFDRVLIDAPCSGTGTWRRNPDARWTLTAQDVAELRELQARIVASASRLVKPGGRLVYVTCSLLPAENERQAEVFAAQPGFTPVPISTVWAGTIGGACPPPDPYLRLSPERHGTDGFFVAVFERRSENAGGG
ncbi:MAG TPA: RsmB/NOP family class I SAM-dependent RNA methyltransferase [Alphaproteobacteria bacterium]